MNSNLKLFVAIASSLIMAGSVAAGAAPAPAKAKPQPGSPDEVVCQKQEIVGSRLATRRICMTRFQWQQQQAADRQDVERSQIPSAKNGPGG